MSLHIIVSILEKANRSYRNRVDHETGAFGEFVLAKASVQIRIPDNVSFEQAATLGVAIATCVSRLKLTGSFT